MRNIIGRVLGIALILFAVLLPFLGLGSCASSSGGQTQPNTQNVVIDWVNFVRFGGITYLVPSVNAGRELKDRDLGPLFATVRFKLDGNVHDPAYHAKDGDAAFLDAGTLVYIVNGYKPTFRLAAHWNNHVQLYEADTNPQAHKSADLLDIGGKVLYIGVNGAQDGVTELGAIKDPHEVVKLVDMVLQAPVNQNYMSQGAMQYFIAFHLLDGTTVIRAYWLNSGELTRGILLPKAFGTAIMQAVVK